MIFLIFAADTQKCNKGSIKKASPFPRFQFLFRNNFEHQMIVTFEGQVCTPLPLKKSAGVCRKMHSHGCKVIFVSLLGPNGKMTMDLKRIYTFLFLNASEVV